MRFPYHYLAVLFATVSLVGCSGGDGDRVPVYPASGQVTMGGEPVADAMVTFSPKGEQPPAVGRTDAQGRYQLKTYEEADGAAAGEYAVIISKSTGGGPAPVAHDPTGQGGSASPDQHRGQQATSALPQKYASATKTPLEAVVTEGGENKFDFTLEK